MIIHPIPNLTTKSVFSDYCGCGPDYLNVIRKNYDMGEAV